MLLALALVAALGCGLMAGTFFAFSVFVMRALGRLPAAQGIAAMQSINIAVVNPWFMTVFLGTGCVCALTMVLALTHWRDPAAGYLLAGAALYLVGTVLVTMACNVPLNNALAALAPASEEGADLWANYLRTWTQWNHVRTLAGLGAACLFSMALASGGGNFF